VFPAPGLFRISGHGPALTGVIACPGFRPRRYPIAVWVAVPLSGVVFAMLLGSSRRLDGPAAGRFLGWFSAAGIRPRGGIRPVPGWRRWGGGDSSGGGGGFSAAACLRKVVVNAGFGRPLQPGHGWAAGPRHWGPHTPLKFPPRRTPWDCLRSRPGPPHVGPKRTQPAGEIPFFRHRQTSARAPVPWGPSKRPFESTIPGARRFTPHFLKVPWGGGPRGGRAQQTALASSTFQLAGSRCVKSWPSGCLAAARGHSSPRVGEKARNCRLKWKQSQIFPPRGALLSGGVARGLMPVGNVALRAIIPTRAGDPRRAVPQSIWPDSPDPCCR